MGSPTCRTLEASEVIVCPLAFEINFDLPWMANDRRHVFGVRTQPTTHIGHGMSNRAYFVMSRG